jgi:hypothetical protein
MVNQQWNEWIMHHSKERLLAACYILDSRNALLLGRHMHTVEPSLGLGILTPASSLVWDAPNHAQWMRILRSNGPQPNTIGQLLERIDCNPDTLCDNFQSAVVLACYSASVLTQSQDTMGLACPTHPIFELIRAANLVKALSEHPSVRIMYAATRLISVSPFRALVATAGQSWFFGKKLSNVAKDAAEEFESLKHQLQAWTSNSTLIIDPVNGASTPFLAAISLALDIISMANSNQSPNLSLAFGPELALYFASLVIWAATYSAQKSTNSHFESHETGASDWDPSKVESLVRSWLPHAASDVKHAIPTSAAIVATQPTGRRHSQVHNHMISNVSVESLTLHDVLPTLAPSNQAIHQHQYAFPVGTIFPPPLMLSNWQRGVSNTLKWTAQVLGSSKNGSTGTGQLAEGLVEVLEKLNKNAWQPQWF